MHSGAVGGKTGKTSVLPGFRKIYFLALKYRKLTYLRITDKTRRQWQQQMMALWGCGTLLNLIKRPSFQESMYYQLPLICWHPRFTTGLMSETECYRLVNSLCKVNNFPTHWICYASYFLAVSLKGPFKMWTEHFTQSLRGNPRNTLCMDFLVHVGLT